MANEGYIIVPSGLKPVHSLDVFGVIVDGNILGAERVKLFQQIAEKEGLSPEQAQQIIYNYMAIIRGEPWAIGERKQEFARALNDRIKKYGLVADYTKALLPDCLDSMREILDANEGIIILSTGDNRWVKDSKYTGDIAERIGEHYEAKKSGLDGISAFQKVYASEMAKGNRMVSHTADEMPELEAAVASGIFSNSQGRLIFVARNDKVSREETFAKGIDTYVTDLKDVHYSQIVQRQ